MGSGDVLDDLAAPVPGRSVAGPTGRGARGAIRAPLVLLDGLSAPEVRGGCLSARSRRAISATSVSFARASIRPFAPSPEIPVRMRGPECVPRLRLTVGDVADVALDHADSPHIIDVTDELHLDVTTVLGLERQSPRTGCTLLLKCPERLLA